MTAKRLHNTVAGMFGNLMDDFSLYASFSVILSPLFFPSDSAFFSLLMTFGVFALGYLARPFGGLLFGLYGDSAGRKAALTGTIVALSAPTLLIGLLPDFATIGYFAPLCLILLRLIQGLAVGGEISNSSAYLVEHANSNRRGLAGSLVLLSCSFGMLVGTGVTALLCHNLSESFMQQIGWRLPFICYGLFGLIGLVLRLRSDESPCFTARKDARPAYKRIQEHWKPLLRAIGVMAAFASGTFFLIAYTTPYLVTHHGFPLHLALLLNCGSWTLFTCLLPVFGFLSDKFGRKPILISGLLVLIFSAHPILKIFTGPHFSDALLGEMLFAVVLAPIAALMPTTLAEMFPTPIRATGFAIAYNTGLALFGGTAPMIFEALEIQTHNPLSPAWVLIVAALISLVVVLSLRETYQTQLD